MSLRLGCSTLPVATAILPQARSPDTFSSLPSPPTSCLNIPSLYCPFRWALRAAQVALTIGIAPTALKRAEERTIGDKTIIPAAVPIGRVVIGGEDQMGGGQSGECGRIWGVAWAGRTRSPCNTAGPVRGDSALQGLLKGLGLRVPVRYVMQGKGNRYIHQIATRYKIGSR